MIPIASRKIKVLVVDDSALVRKVLTKELAAEPDIEVVGAASDPYVARDMIVQLSPDVITLDIEMPRMDGLTFLERLMRHRPTAVIVVSSLTASHGELAMRALALGAVEVVPKPGSQFSSPNSGLLARAVRAGAVARIGGASRMEAPPTTPQQLITTDKVLAIGASTGGTRAIEALLRGMPATCPATIVVQHMPTGFTTMFAARLASIFPMTIREAQDGDPLSPGVVLIAPSDKHTKVVRTGGHYVARVVDGPPIRYQRPSVDVLFESVATSAGQNAVGVILTGMGDDGAAGLLSMRKAGAHTVAEDASTCVVFGMPRAAIELGAAVEVLPLHRITAKVLSRFDSPTMAHAVGAR